MSFSRDLESGGKARPTQRFTETSSFEQRIRSNIQDMQGSVRLASEQLERCRKSCLSKRIGDSVDRALERGQDLTEVTEQLFRDWTVHLAGEPAVRFKSKFVYEKLQKACQDEAARLKHVGRRTIAARQEALKAGPGSSMECLNMCEDQGSSMNDEEHFLLAPSSNSEVAIIVDEAAIQSRIAIERAEGIHRIQSQVTEVNQMFRDLASMASDQGQQLETIEQQTESASSNTEIATKELKKTYTRQRGHFEKLCCTLVLSMLVLCFVLVSNMPHLRSSSSGGLK